MKSSQFLSSRFLEDAPDFMIIDDPLIFRVHGIPVTQGSARAFMPRDKKTGRPLLAHPIVTHDNRRPLRSWRDAVATEALRARGRTGLLNGPLYVHLRFLLPRPRSRPAELRTEKQRAEWTWPWRRPDVDKCQRAVLDALKGILYHDDAQIVRIDAWKEYAADPGVEIMIERLL